MKLQKYTNGWYEDNAPDYVIQDLNFIGTCGSCPEQYDVVNSDGYYVGYLRLRGGLFKVQFPNADGVNLFMDLFIDRFGGNNLKGCFDSEEERIDYLEIAATCINKQLSKFMNHIDDKGNQ